MFGESLVDGNVMQKDKSGTKEGLLLKEFGVEELIDDCDTKSRSVSNTETISFLLPATGVFYSPQELSLGRSGLSRLRSVKNWVPPFSMEILSFVRLNETCEEQTISAARLRQHRKVMVEIGWTQPRATAALSSKRGRGTSH